MKQNRITSSYRDPSGFVLKKNGEIFRQINPIYKKNYDLLMTSGLYKELVKEKLLIPHKEISKNLIKPEQIPFISYPYEWCFLVSLKTPLY